MLPAMIKSLPEWLQRALRNRVFLMSLALAAMIVALAWSYLQNDFHRGQLDPKIPFQIYVPPEAPDYRKAESWFLNPAIAKYSADPRKVDVFFIHATSYNGGGGWLGPIDKGSAIREVEQIQLPNYAGPFAVGGNIYAPKYRQASLFTQLTGREDARQAREFAYTDIDVAFERFLKTRKGGKGFVIVGLEQGALLAQKLVRTRVVANPDLKAQLVAVYLIESLVPEEINGKSYLDLPPCAARVQTGCVVAYQTVASEEPESLLLLLRRGVYWNEAGYLEALDSRPAICVNPLTGAAGGGGTDEKASLGATNATGLEWGTPPPLIPHKVSARCVRGLLTVDKPSSPAFKAADTWEGARKVNSYNLFYGDLQADFQARADLFRTTSEKN